MSWEPVEPVMEEGSAMPEWAYDKLTEQELVELRICLAERFNSGYNFAIARMNNGEF